jgi:hypothetical protein
MTKRPGGVTAVCILAMLLAAAGLFASLIAAATLVIGPERLQEMMPQPKGENEARIQREMQAEINAVTEPLKPITTTLLVLEALTCIGLLVASIRTLGLHEQGRRLLRLMLILAIPLTMVRSTVGGYMTLGIADAQAKFMPELMAAQQKGNKLPADFGEKMAQISRIFGMVWIVGSLVVVLIIYIVSWLYLNRPRVVAAFAATADDELA